MSLRCGGEFLKISKKERKWVYLIFILANLPSVISWSVCVRVCFVYLQQFYQYYLRFKGRTQSYNLIIVLEPHLIKRYMTYRSE